MKLWRVQHLIDGREPNGWIIYCKIGKRVMSSWWSSPGDYCGDMQYLQNRGYGKVNTPKRVAEFKRLWEKEKMYAKL